MEKITDIVLILLQFTIVALIAVWVFLTFVVPAADNFLFDKVQYVPYCPNDPPEGLELMGEPMLL